jgi:hypothetical protein
MALIAFPLEIVVALITAPVPLTEAAKAVPLVELAVTPTPLDEVPETPGPLVDFPVTPVPRMDKPNTPLSNFPAVLISDPNTPFRPVVLDMLLCEVLPTRPFPPLLRVWIPGPERLLVL